MLPVGNEQDTAAVAAVQAVCVKEGFAVSSAAFDECKARVIQAAWVACGKFGAPAQSRAQIANMLAENIDRARSECAANRLIALDPTSAAKRVIALDPTPAAKPSVKEDLDPFHDPDKLERIAHIFLQSGSNTGMKWLALAHSVRAARRACGLLGFAADSDPFYDCVDGRTQEAVKQVTKADAPNRSRSVYCNSMGGGDVLCTEN